MKVAITGSHGLIGRHLAANLEGAGHQVLRVVRGSPGAGEAAWDPSAGRLDASTVEVDAVVHLAGVGIAARRWNDAHRRAVLDSRVQGTSLVASRIAESRAKPAVLVSASAIGFYGDRGDEALTERSAEGQGFLPRVCRSWEGATRPAIEAGVRTVLLRSGIVQSADGGALKPQVPLFKLGLGARLGSGRQWVSWVSIDDEVGAILHALRTETLSGPLNVVAPSPVTNAAYTAALAEAVHRPALLAVPAPVLRAALGRQMADEMLLTSQRVTPDALTASGYDWHHPSLQPTLKALLGGGR